MREFSNKLEQNGSFVAGAKILKLYTNYLAILCKIRN